MAAVIAPTNPQQQWYTPTLPKVAVVTFIALAALTYYTDYPQSSFRVFRRLPTIAQIAIPIIPVALCLAYLFAPSSSAKRSPPLKPPLPDLRKRYPSLNEYIEEAYISAPYSDSLNDSAISRWNKGVLEQAYERLQTTDEARFKALACESEERDALEAKARQIGGKLWETVQKALQAQKKVAEIWLSHAKALAIADQSSKSKKALSRLFKAEKKADALHAEVNKLSSSHTQILERTVNASIARAALREARRDNGYALQKLLRLKQARIDQTLECPEAKARAERKVAEKITRLLRENERGYSQIELEIHIASFLPNYADAKKISMLILV